MAMAWYLCLATFLLPFAMSLGSVASAAMAWAVALTESGGRVSRIASRSLSGKDSDGGKADATGTADAAAGTARVS